MIKLAVTVVLMFGLAVCSSNATADDRDGRWWNHESRAEKLSYVAGFFDAFDYFNLMLTGASLKAMADPRTGKFSAERSEVVKATSISAIKSIQDELGGLTAGQVSDGLDTLYADYKNQGIPISSCIYVVIFAIRGGSESEVNKLLEARRRQVAK